MSRRLDQILKDVADRQIHLYLEDGKLKFRAPKNALDSSLAGEIKQYKPQIIQMLNDSANSNPKNKQHTDQKPVVSYAQERLWFLQKLEQQNTAYHIQALFSLEGKLDMNLLQVCFKEIIARHDILRTTFTESENGVLPVISSDLQLDFEVISINGKEFNRDYVLGIAREEMNTPFDLEHGPLLRSRLIHDGNESHYLILTIHHIITDGWSHSIFFDELTTLYKLKSENKPVSLPPLATQYTDYALAQRNRFEVQSQNEGLRFLTEHLSGAPPFLELPTDYRRPARQSFQGKLLSRDVPDSISEPFRKLCQESGTTLYSGLLTIFQCWLYRLSEQKTVLTGTPVSGRTSSEIENLIGFFVNTLVVRTDINPGSSFRDLLKSVGERIPELIQYQDVPFEKVVEEIQPMRNLEYNPLFQVFFNMLSHEHPKIELPGVTIQQLPLPDTSTPFDLTLYAVDTEDCLKLELLYALDLFSEERAEIMLTQIISMIRQAVEQPTRMISDFSLVSDTSHSDSGKRQVEFNKGMDLKSGTVTGRIMQSFERRANEPAIITENGAISYQNFEKRVQQLTSEILKKKSAGVAILSGRSETVPLGMISSMLSGVPFINIDSSYPYARICTLLQKSNVDTLLLSGRDELSQKLSDFIQENNIDLITIETDPSVDQFNEKYPFSPGAPDALAYWAATSGTTRESKLIAGSRAPVDHFVNWYITECDVKPGDRFTMLSGISHDPLLRDILVPLAAGGTLIIPGTDQFHFPARLVEWLKQMDIHYIHITPALMQILIDSVSEDEKILSVKQIIFGGDILKTELVRKVNQLFPNARILNGYGSTETPQLASFYELNHLITGRNPAYIPVGSGLNGSKLIVRKNDGSLCGVGEPGEVCVESNMLSLGYWNDGIIHNDHFEATDNGKLIYKTGDKGSILPDGSVAIIGRLDRQLNIHGFRVDPAEIEECLNRQSIVEKAVVWAQNDRCLAAFTVTKDHISGQPEDHLSEQLKEMLKQSLPSYMIPDRIFQLPQFPLTSNGKIDFNKLSDLDLNGQDQPVEYQKARDLTEKKLATIWTDLLNREKISIHEDFFRAGGHSLLAAKLNNRIRKEFGVELSLRDHFTYTTIRSLAARIKSGLKRNSLQIHAAKPKERYPLSHAQRRLWVLSKIDETSVVYNMPRALKITGDLQVEKVEFFLEKLIADHSILRTVFREEDDEPVQIILPKISDFFEHIDLSSHNDPLAEAKAITDAESQKPFNLEAGPLFKSLLLKTGPRTHILYFNIHHIISDGWSMEMIEKEFMATISSGSKNGKSEAGLNGKRDRQLQYSDFTLWQSGFLSSDYAADLRSYWHQQFQKKPQLLDLPSDYPRPPVKTYNGNRIIARLNRDLCSTIHSISNQSGCSEYVVLNTLISTLLFRYSGCSDFVVGTPSAGRVTGELENCIGCFVNMLPLRVQPDSGKSFTEFMHEIKQTTIDAFSNEAYPYDKLIDELDLERRPDRTPLFDVAIVYQNPDKKELTLQNLEAEPFNRADGVAKYDLTFTFEKESDTLALEIEYNSDLYRKERIHSIIEQFKTLIQSVEKNPRESIARLDILSETQLNQIRSVSIPDKPDWPSDKTIHQLFTTQAEYRPEQVAIISGSEKLTYNGLNVLSDKIAAYLQDNGCKKGDFVTFEAERNPGSIAAIIGILKAGCVYVPVDPEHPEERRRFIRDDCNAQIHLNSEQIEWVRTEYADGSGLSIQPNTDPSDPAYVIYTSGSTGKPKGCIINHNNVVQLLFNDHSRFDFSDCDTWISTHSFCFDFSVWEMYGALLYGGKLIIASKNEVRNPELLHQLLQKHAVTILNQTPASFYNLIEADLQHDVPQLSDLRMVIFGGDRLEPAYLKKWIDRYDLGRICLINMYGITETTVHVTYHQLTSEEILDPDGSSPIGHPLPLTNLYVLDEFQQFCPMGVPGELYVGGQGVSLGYHNRDELNALKFLPDPFEPGRMMYKSGDVGTLKYDLSFEYNGRNDHQIQLHGFRIETGEIESILNRHEQILKSVVLLSGREESSKKLIAFCVIQNMDRTEFQPSAIRDFLQKNLPDYMIPAQFVMIDEFPLTSNGKIDRAKLLSIEFKQSVQIIINRKDSEMDHRGDITMTWVQQLWEKLLDIPAPDPDTNFFDLGGNSLTLMKLNSELRKKMKTPLPVVELFRYTTIRSLSEQLKKHDPELEKQLTQNEKISQK